MKRVVYLASTTALLASMVLAGNVFAAKPAKTTKVQLCTSTPYGVPALQGLSQGIRNGATLAIKYYAKQLKKAGVVVKQVNYDDAKADGSSYDPTKEKTNADNCLSLGHSLGYVGTLNSGAALVSEPVLNKGHMVMISPANTNPTLTDPKSRASQEPATAKHQIPYVTYYRTVTTDKLQGPSGATFAKTKLKAKSFYLVDDGLQYGVGLASFFEKTAKKLGMKEVGKSRIDTNNQSTSSASIAHLIEGKNPSVVYCGCDSETSNALPGDLRAAGWTKPFMGGDALVNSAWTGNGSSGAGPGAKNNDATSVGPDISRSAKFFSKLYKKYLPGFYKSPGIQAYDATSFDAASAILLGIIHVAKAHKLSGGITKQRTAVVAAVHGIHFTGATGKTSFDKNGDTKNKIVSIYHTSVVKGSLQWVFKSQLVAKGSPV
jgi:branched-chain amino acid transport system substrate-binding protein